MKRLILWTIYPAVLFLTVAGLRPAPVLASEKIGNLVFDAMKEIQQTHETFLSQVQGIRTARKAAANEREKMKKQFERAVDGSLDKKEYHAQYSYAVAQVLRALFDEAKLTRGIAGRQLNILNNLNDSITSGESSVDSKVATSVVDASKPFLNNGKSLLKSLAQFRNQITDPVINSKLNAAYDTARVLSAYVQHIEKGKTSRYASKQVLQQKVTELIEQLNALYVQTDIFMAMVRDKSTRLKIITELAASDAAISILVEGKQAIDGLSKSVINPMINELDNSGQDLDILLAGVFEETEPLYKSAAGSQRWLDMKF